MELIARGFGDCLRPEHILGHRDIANRASKHVEVHERLEAEAVIPGPIGESEADASGLQGGWEPVSESLRHPKTNVDQRLETLVGRHVAQSFLEYGHRKVVMLECGKQEKALGSERSVRRLGQDVGRDRSRSRPLAGSELRLRSRQCSSMPLVLFLAGREPPCLLRELRGSRQRSAIQRQSGRRVQLACNLRICFCGAECQMATTIDWICHARGQDDGAPRDVRAASPSGRRRRRAAGG